MDDGTFALRSSWKQFRIPFNFTRFTSWFSKYHLRNFFVCLFRLKTEFQPFGSLSLLRRFSGSPFNRVCSVGPDREGNWPTLQNMGQNSGGSSPTDLPSEVCPTCQDGWGTSTVWDTGQDSFMGFHQNPQVSKEERKTHDKLALSYDQYRSRYRASTQDHLVYK